jgi:hypothetical protein
VDELRQQIAAANVPAELAVAKARHVQTMILLRALKSGTIRIEQVLIDGETWNVLDPTQVTVAAEPMAASEIRRREGFPEPKEAPEG